MADSQRDPVPTPVPIIEEALDAHEDPPADGATDAVGLAEHLARADVSLPAAAAGEGDADALEEARVQLDDARSALAALGFAVETAEGGHVAGVLDDDLVAAIAQFQDEHDLEVTRTLDPDTYEAIMSAYEQAVETGRSTEDDDGDGGDDFDPMPGGM